MCHARLVVAVLLLLAYAPKIEAEPVRFNRDVRPLLSNYCFQCHGPDETHRQADLRLDEQDGVTVAFEGGIEGSDAWDRIMSTDPDMQMPPPDAHKELKPEELETLKQWIEQGAEWEDHWSFMTPQRPKVPRTIHEDWVINPIDAFVASKLEQRGLKPSPGADRARWLRRVTFDLTGLPPTLPEIDAFLSDTSSDAYERVVDRLLQSNRYGERMALAWMDAARYGDSSVYHADGPREMWAWRDWVIQAYNDNVPFDQFTIDQLAGDLRPDSTIEQRVAAGFNRNHGTTDEGGAIDEEYRVEYIVDRVKTTSTIWLGLTMECAQCHDHKYDPISQRDYYEFFAFFNQATDKGMQTRNGNAEPRVDVFNPLREIKEKPLSTSLATIKATRENHVGTTDEAFAVWHRQACDELESTPPMPVDTVAYFPLDEKSGKKVSAANDGKLSGKVHGKPNWIAGQLAQAFRCDAKTYLDLGDIGNFERTDSFSYGAWIFAEGKVNGAPLSRMKDADSFRGYDLYFHQGRLSVHLVHQWPANAIKVTTKTELKKGKWHHLFVTYDGSSQAQGVSIYIDGQRQELTVNQDQLSGSIMSDAPFAIGRRTPGSPFTGIVDDVRVYARTLSETEAQAIAGFDPISPLLRIPESERTAEQQEEVRQHYLRHFDPKYQELTEQIQALEESLERLSKPVTSVMTMRDLEKPRMTYILNRGSYDAPLKDQSVSPDTLAMLLPMNDTLERNRLGLAQWIVDENHPLTARVAVNRYWSMLFGQGLVRTLGDFGSQGEWPTHPDLLDWLALEFVESGWNVKHMIRLMVNSATYRQTSRATTSQIATDPENLWLGRGPRFRLQGEFIRDNALAASGLLVDRVGGPSTKPYQPGGLWNEVSLSGNVRFVQDHGEKLYRRSMYIFWKRSAPMPSMTIFDAPTREKCVMQRSRTNTPLQALVTLNDPQFIEASRALAERSLLEAGPAPVDAIRHGYQLATGTRPKAKTLSALVESYEQERAIFASEPTRAEKLLAIGESPRNQQIEAVEHAALTIVMNLILNLDETLTRG